MDFSDELNQSDQAILQAASQIFCSAIAAGKVNGENHTKVFSYSIKSALRMASIVKHTVVTDEEVPWPE
jgi:hypothetical protein